MKIITKDWKKFFLFCISLPLIYLIIKIQIYICILFTFYYFIVFFLYHFLKTSYTIKCEEIPLNFSHMTRYVLPVLFIFFPRARGFLFAYNFLHFVFNKNLKFKIYDFIFIFIVFIFIFFIKFSIFLILGYTYLSMSTTANFVVVFFYMLDFNYENFEAKYQHILLNCVLNFNKSIGKSDEMKIIIFSDGSVIFNMKKHIEIFFMNCRQPELLYKFYNILKEDEMIKIYLNNHYTLILRSKNYFDKNVGTNLTSQPFLKVSDGIKEEKIQLLSFYKPNFKGEDKTNYYTPPYTTDLKNNVIKSFPKSMLEKDNVFVQNCYSHLIIEKDTKLLNLENQKFFKNSDNPTLKEFAEEFKLSLYDDIKQIEEFEKINSDFLNSPKGKHDYMVFKDYMRGIKPTNFNDDV